MVRSQCANLCWQLAVPSSYITELESVGLKTVEFLQRGKFKLPLVLSLSGDGLRIYRVLQDSSLYTLEGVDKE